MNRAIRPLIAVGILIALVLLSMPVLTVVGEVGHRDLMIGFTVKDVDTGQPIPDASIHIRREDDGFCKDQDVDDFSIVCDPSGRGSYLVKSCMWSSTHGRFVNNFSMHLPHWWYLASAPRYAQSNELFWTIVTTTDS